jgi:hypothetical protein
MVIHNENSLLCFGSFLHACSRSQPAQVVETDLPFGFREPPLAVELLQRPRPPDQRGPSHFLVIVHSARGFPGALTE